MIRYTIKIKITENSILTETFKKQKEGIKSDGVFFNVLEMSINNTGLYITEKCENTFIYYLSDYVKKNV